MNKNQKPSKQSPIRRSARKATVAPKRRATRKPARSVKASSPVAVTEAPAFGALREELDITRAQFSRLLGYSERAVAEWESGSRTPTEPAARSHRELVRLIQALKSVMKPSYVRDWLMTPSTAFGGLKPLEVIERGETDRIWRMVYEIESGSPV